MDENKSTGRWIICAVRGGSESRSTVTRAVDLALQEDARLTFLHIVDAEFLGFAPIPSRLRVVYEQLGEMAVFIMLILVDRAQRRGVSAVDYQIREGDIRRQLRAVAQESRASALVLGEPVRSPGSNLFTPKAFQRFVADLEALGGLHIITVGPEE